MLLPFLQTMNFSLTPFVVNIQAICYLYNRLHEKCKTLQRKSNYNDEKTTPKQMSHEKKETKKTKLYLEDQQVVNTELCKY